jgi:rod shape-determining protein MreD
MADPSTLGGVHPLSPRRFTAFLVACLAAQLLLSDPLMVRGAAPDFMAVALVYGAIRWGALGGVVMGFMTGIFQDTLFLESFGVRALWMTLVGYGLGKIRETLYLGSSEVDLPLLFAGKLVIDILVIAVAAHGSWDLFELRFFWEVPSSALYTMVVGAVLHRVFRSS